MNQLLIPYIVGVASGLTVAIFMLNRSKFTFKIIPLKELKESESFIKKANLFSMTIQYGLLISIVCIIFLQIGLAMLSGTSAIINGVPLSYVFVVKGLSVLCTFVGSFFLLRLIYIGKDSIFKKHFKFN